ncbi:MAG TPA: NfeD family protein [Candidatus Dormibacteraeota bacterium]
MRITLAPQKMAYVWLVIAIAFLVAEVATLAMFAIFVTVAALGAAAAAAVGESLISQSVVFFLLAVLGIFVARPLLLRYLRHRQSRVPVLSGAQEMIGRTAVVTDPIGGPTAAGHVRIMGEQWRAVSADGSPLSTGQEVQVVEIRNTTLVVAP